jgi:hypothetical protein
VAAHAGDASMAPCSGGGGEIGAAP